MTFMKEIYAEKSEKNNFEANREPSLKTQGQVKGQSKVELVNLPQCQKIIFLHPWNKNLAFDPVRN